MIVVGLATAAVRRHISAFVLVRRDFATTSRYSSSKLDSWKEPIQRGIGEKVLCIYGFPFEWSDDDIRRYLGEAASGIKQFIRATNKSGRPSAMCWIEMGNDDCYAAALKIPPLPDMGKGNPKSLNKCNVIPSNMAALQKTLSKERQKAEKSMVNAEIPKK